jgi:hypothetical protein
VTSAGGWLSLETRRLSIPPEKLMELIASAPRSDDFAEIPSSIKAS